MIKRIWKFLKAELGPPQYGKITEIRFNGQTLWKAPNFDYKDDLC